jgi:3-oxoacyl-(acyl-carrier-protein) synthase
VREVRNAQRRQSVLVAAVAAGVTVVALGALALVGVNRDGQPVSPPAPTAAASTAAGLPMTQVGRTPVDADVLLAGVAWGTRLDLTCSYASAGEEDEYEASPAAEYALVVRARNGSAEQVATWRGLPGRSMHVSGATATRRSDIQTVEVRTADGLVVLRLAV